MRISSRRRRGMSLIETAIIVALSSVLLVMVAMTFSSLLQGQRQFLVRERERREWNRLDALLRQDAHAASQAKCETEETCELSTAAGERWTYRLADDHLLRERLRDGKSVQRESFQLRKGTKAKFQLTNDNDRTLLHLDLDPTEERKTAHSIATAYRGVMLVGGMVPQPVMEEQP